MRQCQHRQRNFSAKLQSFSIDFVHCIDYWFSYEHIDIYLGTLANCRWIEESLS